MWHSPQFRLYQLGFDGVFMQHLRPQNRCSALRNLLRPMRPRWSQAMPRAAVWVIIYHSIELECRRCTISLMHSIVRDRCLAYKLHIGLSVGPSHYSRETEDCTT